MIVGTLLLTTQDGISKWLTVDHGAGEIVFYRGVLSLLMVAVMIQAQGGVAVVRANRPGVNWLRAALALLTSLLVVAAFMYMPLADALAIIFLSPLILTALSALLLQEPVGWRRWSAVATGFVGMLMITRPTGADVDWHVVIPLAAAFAGAFRDIVTRRLGGQDSTLTVLTYSSIVAALGGALFLPFADTVPSPTNLGLFAVAAVLVTVSNFLTIRSFQLAPAALVAPFKYLSLIWAGLIGFVVWGDVPDAWKIIGAGLIAGSSLYVLHRETRRRSR